MKTPRPTPVQLIKFLVAVMALSTITACSGDSSGRVAYNKVEVKNVLPPEGLQHTDAVVLLANAATERELLANINTISTGTAANFDWPRFWSELTLNNGIQSKLETRSRSELFRLHKMSCNAESFSAFTSFVLINFEELPASDFELFVGKDRLCKQSIGQNLMKIALARLKQELHDLTPSSAQDAPDALETESKRGHRARLIAELISFEFELAKSSGEASADPDAWAEKWRDILNVLTVHEWTQVGAALTIYGNARDALQILSMHKTFSAEQTYSRLKRRIIGTYSRSPQLIERAIESLGLAIVARQFQSAAPELYGFRPNQRIEAMQSIMNTLAKSALDESSLPLDHEDRWNETLKRIWILRRTERSMGADLGNRYKLELISRILAWSERQFKSNLGMAIDYLEGQSNKHIQWELYWLRIRILARNRGSLKDFPREHQPSDIDSPEESIIDQYLQNLVAAYYRNADPEKVSEHLNKLCLLLTENGFPQITESYANAKASDRMQVLLRQKGCIEVSLTPTEADDAPMIIVNARDKNLDSPILQVIKLDGINLSLQVRNLVGGHFDFSAKTNAASGKGRSGGSLSLDVRYLRDTILPAFVATSLEGNDASATTTNATPLQIYNGKLAVFEDGTPVAE